MARLEKFKKSDVRNVIKEHSRNADHYKNFVDASRSHLNFGYGHQSVDDFVKHLDERCSEIMQGQEMQSQTKVMAVWAVTYPERLCDKVKGQNGKEYNRPRDPEHVKQFFNAVYDFTVERYGKENIIGAYVHMDETTPHIHIDLVPEAISRKTGRRTVSVASLFTKRELSGHEEGGYQKELQDKMIEVFGKDAGDYIINGRTQGGYTTDELKERTRVNRRQKKREKAIKDREQEIQTEKQKLEDAINRFAELKSRDLIADDFKEFLKNKKYRDKTAWDYMDSWLSDFRESEASRLIQDVLQGSESPVRAFEA